MPEVLDFEQYASRRGAGRADIGDAGLHNPAGHMPQRTWKRFIAAQAAKDHAIISRRAELQKEFDAKVVAGEIREPTALEKTKKTALGCDENPSVQAARRILMRRFGIDYRTLEGYKP